MAGFQNDVNNKDIMFADNVDFSGAANPTGNMTTNGQIFIGSTAFPNIKTGLLGSSDGSITWTFGSGTITGQISGGSTVGKTITGDSGGPIAPTGGNWNLLGQQAGTVAVMDTIGSGSTLKFENRAWQTQLIVDPSSTAGLQGTFTTIASALTAAVSGQTIFIRPGTYTENLTLKAGVNLTGWQSDGNEDLSTATSNVTIIGTVTMTVAGTAVLAGLKIQTNSAAAISVTGTAASQLYLKNCYINCSNNTGIILSSTLGEVRLLNCSGNLGTTGIAFFAISGGSNLLINGGTWGNSGSSLTASTWTNGILTIKDCEFQSFITSSTATGGSANIYNVFFNIASLNTTILINNGTVVNAMTMWNCSLNSGSASAISVGAAASLNLYECTVNSSNTNAITGGGTITYSDIVFTGSSSTINTTTKVPIPWPVLQGGTGASTLTGLLIGNGTSAVTGNAVTQYDVLVGGASNAVSSVGPGSSGQVLQSGGNAANPAYSTSTYPATNAANTILYASSTNTMAALATANTAILATNGSGVPSITTASGNWNNTSRSCFLAYLNGSVSNVTGDGTSYTVAYANTLFDQNSDFNTSTHTFTAPVTGKYFFAANTLLQGMTTTAAAVTELVTTARTCIAGNNASASTGNNYYTVTWMVPMTANDTATIVINVGGITKVVGVYGSAAEFRTTFQGYLIC